MTLSGRFAIYLTHPEVDIDAAVPVPDWGLSATGARRVADLVVRLPEHEFQVVSSAERKALETAWPLAARFRTPVDVRPDLHENDRSATGYLPAAEFEAAAAAFFADPGTSFRGWETARDAQARIVSGIFRALSNHVDKPFIFTGHGGVGTLLYCALAREPIDRRWDQKGGGHWFAFDPGTREVFGHWQPMETLSFR